MKIKTKIIIGILFGASSIFSTEAKIAAKTINISDFSLNNSIINLTVTADDNVLGVQLDIKYNPEELNLSINGIVSKSGIEVYSNIREAGLARVLMFSLTGDKILDINQSVMADLLEIDFQPIVGFTGTSLVTLENVVIAGDAGIDLKAPTSATFEVSYTKPQTTSLSKNYPNPFNPSTSIDYQLSEVGLVSIIVYDLKGVAVKTLVNEIQQADYHNVTWNGFNENGQNVASGRYLLKMIAPGYIKTITMTLLK